MGSWNHGSEGRRLVLYEDLASSSTDDSIATDRILPFSWHMRATSDCENRALISGRAKIEREGFVESIGHAGNGKVIPSSPSGAMINQKFLDLREVPVVSGTSSSCGDSYSTRDSSLIDLKLGRLADCRDNIGVRSPHELRVPSSISSSPAAPAAPVKRSRFGNSNGQAPCCQVHGCNMDLSSSKDYHKRHRVCDAHSKTAKVIVNGIEQRFCQQCSRFHLLAEFDDGKRSCRRRLAGHNERRRKPKLDNLSGRAQRMISSFHGRNSIGSSLAGVSFVSPDISSNAVFHDVSPDISSNAVFHDVKFENNWLQNIKIEVDSDTHPTVSVKSSHMLSKQFHPPYGIEGLLPPSSAIDADTGSLCRGNSNRYMQDYTSSRSVLPNASSAAEEFISFDALSSIDSIASVSNTGCALSLLSCQSQNTSSHQSAIPLAWPLTIQAKHAHCNANCLSEKLLTVSSQPSESMPSNGLSSRMEDDHIRAMLVPDDCSVVAFDAGTDKGFQASSFPKAKNAIFSHEHSQTIDLLPLPSQLPSGDPQRYPAQLKQENEAFCYFHVT